MRLLRGERRRGEGRGGNEPVLLQGIFIEGTLGCDGLVAEEDFASAEGEGGAVRGRG